MSSDLDALRNDIDKLDKELISVLGKRFDAVLKIKAYKQANDVPVLDSGREEEVLSVIKDAATRAGVDPEFAIELYRSIFEESRRIQHEE